jgi:hypothetical protein
MIGSKKDVLMSLQDLEQYCISLRKENIELKSMITEVLQEISILQNEMKKMQENLGIEMNNMEAGLKKEIQGTRRELHDTHLDTQKIRTELHDTHLDIQKIRTEVHDTNGCVKNVRDEINNHSVAVEKQQLEIKKQQLEIKKQLEYKLYKYMDKEKIPEALSDWYFERVGEELDLENPKTYNEIIQWTKLYDFDDEKCKLVDKYQVRDWVKNKIGEKYLVSLIGHWDNPDAIDFDSLPNSFVLKCNHGCGYNIIVKDKAQEDINEIKKKLKKWLHERFAYKYGFEMQYEKIKPCILAEEYLENNDEDLYDYKVFCFNGKAKYVMFLSNRKNGLKMQFYDLDWNLQPFTYNYEKNEIPIPKPDNLDELIKCAEILAEGFIQVRVDFYRLNDGSLKFGEMTFTSSSGMSRWEPKEYNEILGNMIEITKEK